MTALVCAPERSPYAAVQHFDLSGEPHELARNEWNAHKTRAREGLRGIVMHQWASPVGTMAVDRAMYGEAEALARRALATPYTICAGVTQHTGEPVVVLAHPLERYTNASNAGNGEWLAVGIMGRFPFDEDKVGAKPFTEASAAMALAVGAAMDLAVRLLAGPEREAGPWALITHRQTVNTAKGHLACPGATVLRMALQSEAVRRGAIVPEPDIVLVDEFGRPWPDAWRRHLPTFAPAPAPIVNAPKHVAARRPSDLPPPPIVDRPDPRGGEVG